jgi:hypothetical protein
MILVGLRCFFRWEYPPLLCPSIPLLLPPVRNLSKITTLEVVQGALRTQWCIDAFVLKKGDRMPLEAILVSILPLELYRLRVVGSVFLDNPSLPG